MHDIMPTITLKNVPEELHRRLTERAERNRRSLNQEVIHCLELMAGSGHADAPPLARAAFFEELREARAEMRKKGIWLTDESIRDAVDRDRDDEMGDAP